MSFKEEASLFGNALRHGLWLILLIAIFAGIIEGIGFLSKKFYAPLNEQVRYETFKESQAYNDGMLRDLQNLKMEYQRGNPEQQAALKAIVLQRFSVYDINRLPLDLQSFYFGVSK